MITLEEIDNGCVLVFATLAPTRKEGLRVGKKDSEIGYTDVYSYDCVTYCLDVAVYDNSCKILDQVKEFDCTQQSIEKVLL